MVYTIEEITRYIVLRFYTFLAFVEYYNKCSDDVKKVYQKELEDEKMSLVRVIQEEAGEIGSILYSRKSAREMLKMVQSIIIENVDCDCKNLDSIPNFFEMYQALKASAWRHHTKLDDGKRLEFYVDDVYKLEEPEYFRWTQLW